MSSRGIPLRQLDEYTWEVPKDYKPGMRVPARIFADKVLLSKMLEDLTIVQAVNVAYLPGIQKWSITLPDGHQGYGFPIGGVAAMDAEEGYERIARRLAEIDTSLAREMEEEYVFMYPHVVERLKRSGISPRVAYEPSRIPEELV